MSIAALTPPTLPFGTSAVSPTVGGLDPAQRDFASLLGIGERRAGTPAASADAESSARDTAQRFVSVALVQPILDMARESNDAAPPFKPSRGEQQFQSLIDARTAMEIVRSSNFPIVDRIARELAQRATALSESNA